MLAINKSSQFVVGINYKLDKSKKMFAGPQPL